MTKKTYIYLALTLIGLSIVFFQLFRTPAGPKTEIDLGKKLFFDPILSSDNTISCASCHKPELAFADDKVFSKGVRNQDGVRNTPSSMNMVMRPHFFFDGRAATLAEQVLQPIHNPIEMDLPIAAAIKKLKNSHYNNWFNEIYEADVDSTLLSQALTAFINTLESQGDSPFDKWMAGDTAAMTPNQVNGRTLFMEKAKCFDCHFSPDFTGDEFRNVGLFNGSDSLNDVGRFEITKDSTDIGKMKVPGLRNIAVTAPYMHNGMFQTLEEVVEYYDDPSQFIQGSINMDTLLQKPLGLTTQEKKDIVSFLEALTDEQFIKK